MLVYGDPAREVELHGVLPGIRRGIETWPVRGVSRTRPRWFVQQWLWPTPRQQESSHAG